VIWVRNLPWPGSRPWKECKDNGFAPGIPVYLSTWLVIIVDNILHVSINGAAITYLG
jgi:hypothetical protein